MCISKTSIMHNNQSEYSPNLELVEARTSIVKFAIYSIWTLAPGPAWSNNFMIEAVMQNIF